MSPSTLNEYVFPWIELDLDTATDSGDYRTTFERCLAEIGWTATAPLQGTLVDGRYHGLAIGCYFEGGASGPRENVRLALAFVVLAFGLRLVLYDFARNVLFDARCCVAHNPSLASR